MNMTLSRGDSSDGNTATIRIALGDKISEVFFRTNDTTLTVSSEMMCCMGLPVAMKSNAVLEPGGSVSPAFLRGIHTLSDILSSWYPELSPLQIKVDVAAASPDDAATGTRVGAFFSGGVDSFYTLLKHQDEITDIILVHGFDIAVDDADLRAEVSRMARKVAAALGKRLIEVETDARKVFEAAGLWWGEHSHGAALACVGHAIGADMRTIYVSATHTYRELFPWGSHPLLDAHWGTDRLSFRHDGCAASRIQKVWLLAQHPIALSSLRVCYENRGGAYNCGQCEKCLRTMLNLAAARALDRAATFPTRLEPKAVRAMTLQGENGLSFARENIEALARVPDADALRRALNVAFGRAKMRMRLVALVRRSPRVFNAAKRAQALWADTRRSLTHRATRPT